MRVRVVLAVMAVAAVFAGTAEAAPRYTALGDSYAAGPLIPPPLPPLGCLKSSNNYGRIAQRTLALRRVPRRDLQRRADRGHDGAAERLARPEPAAVQLAVGRHALVTLSIGGNDIGFSDARRRTASPRCRFGSPCRDRYTRGGDQISARIAATAPKVAAVLQGIHARSPLARVLVVNYSAIFPHSGNGCWPRMPVARGDVPWLREKQVELNAMLAQQAAANGATIVDVYAASVGRDACAGSGSAGSSRYIPGNAAAPLHPNLRGMQAMAAWSSPLLAPVILDVVDAGLDEAGGRRVGGLHDEPDASGRRTGRATPRRCSRRR